MFQTPTEVSMRQIKGKKEDIIGEFTNDEMEQYVWKLYMYDKVMPMYDIEY